MGLSLLNIAKKIGDVLGGAERQVNPFDHGATYSNPTPTRPAPVNTGGGSVWTPNTGGVRRVTSGPTAPVRPSGPTVVRNVVGGDDGTQGNDYRSIISKLWDQANPADNGRTFHNATPTNTRSVVGQATHNAATNLTGDMLVKPLVINPGQMAVDAGRAAVATATHNRVAQDAATQRLGQRFQESAPGFVVNQGINATKAIANTPQAVMADIHGFQGKRPTMQEQNALHGGLTALNSTVVGQMVSPAESAINSTIPGAKEASAAAGYDVNASGAKKYLADPAMGTVGAAGIVAGVKAGVSKVVGKGKPVVKPVEAARDVSAIPEAEVVSQPKTNLPQPSKATVKNTQTAREAVVEQPGKNVQLTPREGDIKGEGGLRDKIAQHMIDNFAPAINTLKYIEKKTGKTDLVDTFNYNVDRLLRSSQGAQAKFRDDPYAQAAVDGLSRKEINEFDRYTNARAELKNYDKSMKTFRSREENTAIEKAGREKYGARFDSLNQYYRNTVLPDAVRSGRITMARAKQLAKNKNYVHLSRDMGDLQTHSGTSNAITFSQSKVDLRRRGSKRELLSPTQAALDYAKHMEKEHWKNTTATHLVQNLADHGLARKVTAKEATHENAVTIKVNGKPEHYIVSAEIKKITQNLKPFELGKFLNAAAVSVRLLRAGATSMNPVFAAANPVKDIVSSAVLSTKARATHAPENVAAGYKNSGADFIGAKTDPLWHRYEEVGGNMTQYDLVRNAKGSQEIIRRMAGGKKEGARQALRHPLRTFEDANSITEKATRFQNFKGIYEDVIKQKGSPEAQAEYSGIKTLDDLKAFEKNHPKVAAEAEMRGHIAGMEHTINFGRAGDFGRLMNLFVPYSNAAIQGGRQYAKATRDRPISTTSKGLGFVGAPIAAATLWNTSDPERKKVYENIDEFEKQNNLIFVVGKTKEKDVKAGGYGVFKIPLPPDIGSVFQPIRRFIEHSKNVKGAQTSPQNYATDVTKPFVGPVNLSSPTAAVGSVTPQWLKPGAQQWANVDAFTGKKIEPDYLKDQFTNPKDRKTKYTSITAQELSNITGVSPVRIDKFIKDVTGTGGSILVNAADNALVKAGRGKQKDDNGKFITGGTSIPGGYKRRFGYASAKTDPNNEAAQHFAAVDESLKGLNADEQAGWKAIHPSKVDGAAPDKTPIDGKLRADVYMKYPKVWEADKKTDAADRKRGQPGNPVFDLNDNQRRTLLAIQTSNPGDTDAKVLEKDSPWLQDYYKKSSDYFDKVIAEAKAQRKKDGKPDVTTSDPIWKSPTPSDSIKRSLDAMNQITDSKQKSQYIRDNPEVQDYLARADQATRAKRAWIGLEQFDAYPTADKNTQGLLDKYGSLPQHDGKKGGNKSRYDFIQAHPEISDYFNQVAQYSANEAAKTAMYQGHDNKGSGSGGSSSSSSSSSSSGSGSSSKPYVRYASSSRSGGYSSNYPTANSQTHVIAQHGAGASYTSKIQKPSVRKAKARTVVKPKVSLKKSR